MRDTSAPATFQPDSEPGAEDYFHVDAYRTNRFGQAVERLDRMTRFPMVEAECRVMIRALNRSARPNVTYCLTKAD